MPINVIVGTNAERRPITYIGGKKIPIKSGRSSITKYHNPALPHNINANILPKISIIVPANGISFAISRKSQTIDIIIFIAFPTLKTLFKFNISLINRFYMLNLMGLGLSDEKGLTLEGLETLKKSDKVYIELYTSKWFGSIENLEKMTGKKIMQLKRPDLEENLEKILKEAKNQTISILILGDPLVATTHTALLIEAKKLGIKTRVIHNASIYSAAGETGLHLYKFGATVTIPFLEKMNNQFPESLSKIIRDNKGRDLHTLCLLDLISEKEKYMTPSEGMEVLLKSDDITQEDEIVIFGRAGSEEPLIAYGKIKNLIDKDFGNPPFVLIILGKLHFTEKEYLEYHRAD